MTQETITPGRGSPESAEWFRSKLDELDIGQSELARLMVKLGDDRQMTTILRSLGRMASGDARVSGEMRAFLATLGRYVLDVPGSNMTTTYHLALDAYEAADAIVSQGALGVTVTDQATGDVYDVQRVASLNAPVVTIHMRRRAHAPH